MCLIISQRKNLAKYQYCSRFSTTTFMKHILTANLVTLSSHVHQQSRYSHYC